MTTRLAPGHHHAVVQRALEHPDHAGVRRRTRLQHGCGRVGFGELLDDAVRGAGAGRDDRRRTRRSRRARAASRRSRRCSCLRPAGRRRRPDVEFDRRLVGQLAQRPPRMAAAAGRSRAPRRARGNPNRPAARRRSARHRRPRPTDQDASRNSRPVLIRSAARVRTFSGSQTSTGVPAAS